MARPKKPEGEVKDQRVPIVMSEAELKQLDDWMHEHRIRSRGEAIRRLCQIGIVISDEDFLVGLSINAVELAEMAVHAEERRRRDGSEEKFVAAFEALAAAVMLLTQKTVPIGVKIHAFASGLSVEEAFAQSADTDRTWPALPPERRIEYEVLVEEALKERRVTPPPSQT